MRFDIGKEVHNQRRIDLVEARFGGRNFELLADNFIERLIPALVDLGDKLVAGAADFFQFNQPVLIFLTISQW